MNISKLIREYADGTEHIKLHNTVIYKRTKGGTITLNSGGYQTVTTKRRMNTLLAGTPYRVFQKNRDWYVSDSRDGSIWPFKDGCKLTDWS